MSNAMREMAAYLAVVILSFVCCLLLGLDLQQVISITVFASFIAGSLFFWSFRNAFALAGVALLLLLGVLDIEHLVEFANLDIVLFLAGMMIVVGYLEEKGFFDWILELLVRPFRDKPTAIIMTLLIMGTLMAALVDEVTSILFMMAIMLRVLKAYGIEGRDALPFILFLVFTTNIGSSALPVGNPIGVMIAFRAGLTIAEFLRWVAPLAMLNSVLVALLGALYLKRRFSLSSRGKASFECGRPLKSMIAPLLVFISVLCGLVLHHGIEEILELPKNTMLLATPLIGAGAVMLIHRRGARELVEKKVDWWTLLYFVLLFSSVGTLKYTGVTDLIAEGIMRMAGEDALLITLLVGGVTSILTAFMDNVLAVATLIPVVHLLAASGVHAYPIWWIMLIGGTYCGNATVIGSTANIVAAGYVEMRGYGRFSMLEWVKFGAPISILTFFLSFALLYLQTPLMPH